MTDRELLEAAARAAGMELDYTIRPDGLAFYHSDRNAMALADGGWFAPLVDDGDALRLAVKLHIDFKSYDETVRTWVGDPVAQRVIASIEELCGTDPYAASRRAIVRAAAALAPSQEIPK